MSLPGDTLYTPPQPAEFFTPDSLGRPSLSIDFERGGVALNDPSEGLEGYIWRARASGSDILVGRSPYSVESVVISPGPVSELSLAFDQNMNVALAYVLAGRSYLYWYDTVAENYETTDYGTGVTSPFLTFDDKRDFATNTNTNDVLFFYLSDGKLRYRQQRDRYATERDLYDMPSGEWRIKRCGMASGLRVQIELEASL